jgi:hypothetical protein
MMGSPLAMAATMQGPIAPQLPPAAAPLPPPHAPLAVPSSSIVQPAPHSPVMAVAATAITARSAGAGAGEAAAEGPWVITPDGGAGGNNTAFNAISALIAPQLVETIAREVLGRLNLREGAGGAAGAAAPPPSDGGGGGSDRVVRALFRHDGAQDAAKAISDDPDAQTRAASAVGSGGSRGARRGRAAERGATPARERRARPPSPSACDDEAE